MTFDLSLSESAGSRSLHRFVIQRFSWIPFLDSFASLLRVFVSEPLESTPHHEHYSGQTEARKQDGLRRNAG